MPDVMVRHVLVCCSCGKEVQPGEGCRCTELLKGEGEKCPICTKPMVRLPWGLLPTWGCLRCRIRVEVFPLTQSDMDLLEEKGIKTH